MRYYATLVTAAMSLVFLCGADGCPVTVGSSDTTQSSSTTTSSLDVGGQSGAKWQLTFEQDVLVTLRLASGNAAAQKVPLQTGIVNLLGAAISVGSLCWRSDVVCPQGVLAEQTPIQQPATGGLLIGFNPRGPLAAVHDAGLTGALSNAEIDVPLAVGDAAKGLCGMGDGSAILASAYASSGSRADSLQGRVIVVYSGICANLGGAAIPADSRIELSVGFAGKRL